MSLTRTPHWATRELHAFLLERAKAPFVWGLNDCCLFPADAIASFTGVDLAAAFRGEGGTPAYTDLASAMALVEQVTGGGKTVGDAAAWCAAQHGLQELVHPLLAQRGDLVTMMSGGVEIGGIVHLNGRELVSVGEAGLMVLPITAVRRAWRV